MPAFNRSLLKPLDTQPWRYTAFLLLAACGAGGSSPTPQPSAQWEIGPTGIDSALCPSGNCSIGEPLYTNGSITISPTQQPHYVTRPGTTPPTHLRFTVTGPLIGAHCSSNSMVSLYFATKDNDWSSDGQRWWSGATTIDHAGEYDITPVAWTSVKTMTSQNSPLEYARARANAGRVGLTFGNCIGLGHGATADGSVVFTINEFE